jgi:hypothetical protein
MSEAICALDELITKAPLQKDFEICHLFDFLYTKLITETNHLRTGLAIRCLSVTTQASTPGSGSCDTAMQNMRFFCRYFDSAVSMS